MTRRLTVLQGQHEVTDAPDAVLTTVLGSCISVCLHDPRLRLGGMNHFLLPCPSGPAGSAAPAGDLQRYGIHAMEVLINALMKRGADRSRLKAHVYGGANIVAGLGSIGDGNAAFARQFLATEGIAIVHEDVGGRCARRVEFLPNAGRSRCLTVTTPPPVQIPAVPVVAATANAGELELF